MASPEYVICLDCETPCYVFEWEDGRLTEALCAACGNDNTDQFASPEELEARGRRLALGLHLPTRVRARRALCWFARLYTPSRYSTTQPHQDLS